MAGGTTSILLKNFTEKDHVLLEKYLKEHSVINTQRPNFWDIHTANKKVKPHGKNVGLRPFIIEFHAKKPEFDDAPDNQTLIKNLGFSNTCGIDIAAMCNDKIDHILQAELSLKFAEMFGGLIYLNGLITPNNASKMTFEEVKNFAKSIEGTTNFAEYTLDSGDKWANQIVDTEYLKNWLKHADFRMIK